MWSRRLCVLLALAACTAMGCETAPTIEREWTAADHSQPRESEIDPERIQKKRAVATAVDVVWAIQCATCHGPTGAGSGARMSAGIDFRSEAWQTSRTDASIAQAIRTGKPPMPSFEGVLTDEDITRLVAFIRTLSGDSEEARSPR